MRNKKTNNKGFIQYVVLGVMVIALLAVVAIMKQKTNITPQASSPRSQAITSPQDLDTASSELDKTDMGQFNADLNQLKLDSSNF